MKCFKICYSFFLVYISLISYNCLGQLLVTPGGSAATLAATLAGPGVTILNPSLTCPAVANGTFTVTGTLLSMTSGIILTNGHATAAAGPYGPPPGTASFNLGAPGDPSLTAILGGSSTYDACVLEFDVVAKGDSIGFNYQFGSQEYYSAVCSHYNDLFAFFISGPGIAGTPNMALVPGTNIPVEINSVNNGIPGSSGGVLSNCTSLGPGSPFTSYYIDNTGGSLLSYKGFTTKFRAAHLVTACDTYHLKLAIADAGNAIYDSGVFLEAASLSTNNFTFNHTDSVGATINGLANSIVRGCSPAGITVLCSHPVPASETLTLTYAGTAIPGTDYTAPGTLILPAGADSGSFTVSALPSLPSGVKTVKIFLSSPTTCGILDSITLNIIDTPSAHIITPDTSICIGASFQIIVSGTPGLYYSWTPVTTLSSGSVMEPVASPTSTSTYTMTATLPGAGCPDIVDSVTATVINTSISMITPDTSFCNTGSVQLMVYGSPNLTYTWLPATGLNNPSVQDPLATPSATTTYTVTATGQGGLCPSSASVTITIGNLNVPQFSLDTTICTGSSIQLMVKGNAGLTYSWQPATGLSDPGIMQPFASPSAAVTYTLTVSSPGTNCSDTDFVTINLSTAFLTNVTASQTIPYGSSVQLNADNVLYYMWTPDDGSLSNASINNPVANPVIPTTYIVTGISKYGCLATDSVRIDLTYDNIFIPSAFTPNNDGLNDVFHVVNLGHFKLVNMSVYNRWGEMVYQVTDGDNKGWDGTYKGIPQDLGVYNYLVIVSGPDELQQTFKGNVTLIR